MFKSFRIGSILGIPLKLDITLLIILPVFAWLIGSQIAPIVELLNIMLGTTMDPAPLEEGATPWLLGAFAAVGLFVGVALHELGHSVVAMHYGYEIDSITLWLLGGLARFTEQPKTWFHEFWIAIAGPIVSIAIGVACYLAVLGLPEGLDGVVFVFGYLAFLNVFLAAFNMIPAFPLDGGRVLRSLFARTQPFAQATQRAVRIGKWFAIALGLFGLLLTDIILIAIAFFIYIMGAAEGRQTLIASVFESVPVQQVMTPADSVVSVPPDFPLSDLPRYMIDHRHSGYPVLQDGDVIGVVTIEDLREIDPEDRETRAVADVMSEDLRTVSPNSDTMDAFEELARSDVGRLLVEDERGDFVGILTRTDLVRAFEIIRQQRAVAESRPMPEPTRRI